MENREQQYTEVDVMMDAVRTISELRIPVELHEDVGRHLFRIKRNLEVVLEMIRQRESGGESDGAEETGEYGGPRAIAEEDEIGGPVPAEIEEIGGAEATIE